MQFTNRSGIVAPMHSFQLDEVEAAFHHYWQTGVVCEDWNAWADLFTADVVYDERVLGSMRGRESVRSWICPLAEQYREIYGVYEWHHADPSGRVVFYMQNRRDLPGGGHVDFPGVSIIHYAGDGLWRHQEDYWATALAQDAYATYERACREHDSRHRDKATRLDWGSGPAWTRGAPSYAERKPAPKWPAR